MMEDACEAAAVLLEIRLLGGFLAQVHGAPMPKLRSRQGVRLLALLALRCDRELERSYVAGLLWPESLETDSLALLRRALTDLRAALGAEAERLLTPTRHSLRLNLAPPAFLDVAAFEADASRGDATSLDSALALYRGPFLEGFHEDWVLAERERLEQRYLQALETRARLATEQGDAAGAALLLRRALAVDPLREANHRSLMETLAAVGDYAALTAAYEQLTRRLRRDLGTEPDETTRTLYRRLRREGKALTPAPAPEKAAPSSPSPVLLPAPLTRFYGRHQEREQLKTLLRSSDTRLITLLGLGGAGKTRLAIEAARESQEYFPGGVWFAPLADVSAPEGMPTALLSVLNLPPEGKGSARERILAFFAAHTGRCLLILDNLEQILPQYLWEPENTALETVRSLLEGVPSLICLATSRQPLRLSGEQEFPLPALSSPSGEERNLEEVRALDSVSLFLDRARSVRPEFDLNEANVNAVAALCRRLEGMPLALEMAAAWIRALTPEQILGRLDRQLDTLISRQRDLPERHRSLRAMLEWSYQLLSEEQRRFFYHSLGFSGWVGPGKRRSAGRPRCAGAVGRTGGAFPGSSRGPHRSRFPPTLPFS